LESQLFQTAREESPDQSVREQALNRLRELSRSVSSMPEFPHTSQARGVHRLRPYAWSILSAAGLAAAAGFGLFHSGHDTLPTLLVTSEQTQLLPLIPMPQQPGASQESTPAAADKSKCIPAACITVKPSNALIVDFTDVSPTGVFVDNDHFSAPNPNWWLNFYGSPYVYPEVTPKSPQALTQTTAGHWNIRGSVRDWSGFGLWFGACTVDMSAYKGVAFDIGGSVGQSGYVKLFVSTGPDSAPEQCRTNVGNCDAKAERCASPSHRFLVNSKMTQVQLSWSDFLGGSPRSTPDPREIIGLMWAFDWTDWGGKKSDPYDVDVNVDNIRLIE
jgi:hypothetical protein